MRRPVHSDEHWRRVRDEVSRMIDEVPLYAGRAAAPGASDAESVSGWLGAMPTVAKRDLRRGFPKNLVRKQLDLKAEMARGVVEIIATSGTTENRLQVLWEWAWWDPQEREGMRLNRRIAEVMAPGAQFREAVLTTPVCGGATCHVGFLSREERTIDGMLFLNQVADPTHWNPSELDRMLAEWNALAPDGVEADPAYLAALCRHATRANVRMHSPGFVTLTYELPTRGHKRAIAAALDSPLYSLYGATETGVLFMECERGRLHHNARHSHIELLPVGEKHARVLVTTLGRTWMPLLRYDLGDIVKPASETRCACGLPENGFLLERVEGRANDALGPLTPAELDDTVEAAEPLDGWQLARDGERFMLHVVGSDGKRAAAAVEKLVGAPVEPRAEAAILPEPSGKYRLVKP
jgi:phenylacetate-coenzyme A ligase PaaK-like adenylate-forming protein